MIRKMLRCCGFLLAEEQAGCGRTGEPGVNMVEREEFVFLSSHLLTAACSSFYQFSHVFPHPCEDLYFHLLAPSSPLFCLYPPLNTEEKEVSLSACRNSFLLSPIPCSEIGHSER